MLPSFIPFFIGFERISFFFSFQGHFVPELRIIKLHFGHVLSGSHVKVVAIHNLLDIYCTNKEVLTIFFPNSRLIINVLHNPGCNNCQPLMSALISNWNQPHLDASKRLKVIFQHRDFLPCLRHLHCHFMDVASGELWLCHISKTHNAMSASQ